MVSKILYKHIYIYLKRWKNFLLLKYLQGRVGHLGKNARIAMPIQTYGLENVFIGDNFECGERLKLRTFSEWRGEKFKPRITIGNDVCIQSDCHISAIDSVMIGNDVLIASFVYISDHQHGLRDYSDVGIAPVKRMLSSKGPVKIGDKVWIGEKSVILPGVTVGDCSIIGAGSVVTKDIPSFSIACGNPAKVIRNITE